MPGKKDKKSKDSSKSKDDSSKESSQQSFDGDSNLKIYFTHEPGVPYEQKLAFEMAGQIWSQYLDDDVTVNIHTDTSDDLPQGVIGGALPAFSEYVDYEDIRSALEDDERSDDDETAVENLEVKEVGSSKLEKFEALFRLETTNFGEDSHELTLTTANAKAMDSSLIPAGATDLDGYIMMSSLEGQSAQWHYADGQDFVPSNKVDFLSVAIHEVGHVLGFVSGVDYSEDSWNTLFLFKSWINSFFGGSYSSDINNPLEHRIDYATTLDLFRFTPESKAANAIDLSLGGKPFFSIDRGKTKIADFATGKAVTYFSNTDNFQASHWKGHGGTGIMAPFITSGKRNEITNTDLRAFDVMGYDRTGGFSPLDYSSLYHTAQSIVDGYSFSRSESRMDDVLEMIESSTLYERRRTRSTTRRQELLDVFAQEALFSSFNGDEWQTYLDEVTVNESGTSGQDTLKGGMADDHLQGKGQADKLWGYEGDDKLRGNQGGDRIKGGDGNDTIVGGLGDDLLNGDAGNDVLRGDAGIDILIGGQGKDIFAIQDKPGFDVIRDFTVGDDQLHLAEGLQVTVGQRNSHAIVTPSGDPDNLLAIIRNVDAGSISFGEASNT